MKGEHVLRIAIATVLAALFATAPGAELGSAETDPGVSTVTVEMRLWQDVHNAENVWISARPKGGDWRALGTIPFPLDADDGTATYRYRDLAIAGAELRVWQKRDESERFYVRACGGACPEEDLFEARSRIRVPLDDGHSSSGRYRYGDLTVAVPLAGPDLLSDWENLLAVRDTLAGKSTLDWDVGTPMTAWTGVTIEGTPQRVTKLNLPDSGLEGQIPPQLGDLTGLTELRLNANALTGPIPLKLQQLTVLTHLYLADNGLTGCVFPSLRSVNNNDLASLGLIDCSTRTYLSPVPEAVIVGEEVVFDFSSDVQGPSATRIGPSAGNTAIATSRDACPSASALPEGGGRGYDNPSGLGGSLSVRGCAVGTTEIQIYQGTTLLQSYPVRVVERTLMVLSDGAASELVLTWSDATAGAATATGWEYRKRAWGFVHGRPSIFQERTWEAWTAIPGDGAVRRHRVTGLEEDVPYDFEVRPLAASGLGIGSNIGLGVPPHIGRDGIPRLNIPYLTATGLDDGGGNTGQIAEGGRTYRLGDSDMVITIPEGLNVTNTTVALDLQAGDIFDLRDVATGNWVVLDFGFNEVRRSVDSEGATPDPNDLFDQMVDSIRRQPEPPSEEPSAAGAPNN